MPGHGVQLAVVCVRESEIESADVVERDSRGAAEKEALDFRVIEP